MGGKAGRCWGERGPSAWENTHPHARTCFHCVSDWPGVGVGGTDFLRGPVLGGLGLPLSSASAPPAQQMCLSTAHSQGLPRREQAASDLCHGVGEGEERIMLCWGLGWTAISSMLPRYHPVLAGGFRGHRV